MNHWRKGLTLALALAVTATTAACGAKTGTDVQPSGTAASDPVKPVVPVKQVQLKNGTTYSRNDSAQEKRMHDLIQEKTGVDMDVQFSAAGQFDNKMNLMLSSGDQLDVIPFVSPEKAIDLYKNDAIVSLDELIEKYGANLKKNIDPQAWPRATFQGKIIGIPNETAITTPTTLMIRTDWLKALNLPMPVTIAEFENVLEAFKNKDPDKNGVNDTYALSIRGDFSSLEKALAPFFLPQGMNPTLDEKTGLLMPPELLSGYKDMMTKLVEWNKLGYIWPDVLLSNSAKQIELMTQNKVGVLAGTFSGTLDSEEILVKTVPEVMYEPLLLKGNGINKIPKIPVTLSLTVVTKRNKNPEAAVKFLDYLATPEGYTAALYGLEGENYTKTSDGYFEFLGEDKVDHKKAPYYGKFYTITINFKNLLQWPLKTFSNRRMAENKAKMEKLPSFDPIDINVVYDKTKWKSYTKQNDMATYLLQEKNKVFSGEVPVSDWDKVMAKWKQIGGEQSIEDQTADYKAAKAK
ncbi:extracellular solute-binding protein [Paenibacillus koleovorans]|uniref:extracellular solute-binding protein n=1 Tax=Paenibacillus koleovorans TaxID=121608 RepID=UPI0013E329B1|nr:extracellular solute-binding protein [Paenibacillus koleovorans]